MKHAVSFHTISICLMTMSLAQTLGLAIVGGLLPDAIRLVRDRRNTELPAFLKTTKFYVSLILLGAGRICGMAPRCRVVQGCGHLRFHGARGAFEAGRNVRRGCGSWARPAPDDGARVVGQIMLAFCERE